MLVLGLKDGPVELVAKGGKQLGFIVLVGAHGRMQKGTSCRLGAGFSVLWGSGNSEFECCFIGCHNSIVVKTKEQDC